MLVCYRLIHGYLAGEFILQKRTVYWTLFGALAAVMMAVQFIPSKPVLVPRELPAGQRDAHRVLHFEGIHNFRDLGGYPAAGGATVKWGSLYRSANLSEASRADQQALDTLELHALVDLRSATEREAQPNQVSEKPSFEIVEIPVLDGGAQGLADEITRRIEDGTLADFDAEAFMLNANRQFADEFTPQFAEFMQVILRAGGEPVLWHCTAGKDRAGFAAAVLLRILGVPENVVLEDYALSRQYSMQAHSMDLMMLKLFKGEEVRDKVAVLLGVEKRWLQAAFDTIEQRWGSFDAYVESGLKLDAKDVAMLRQHLLM